MDLQTNNWYEINDKLMLCIKINSNDITFEYNNNKINILFDDIKKIKKNVYNYEFYNDDYCFRY